MALERRTLALFSGPGLALQAMAMPAVVYLPPYFAGEIGMGLFWGGAIFTLVRFIDLPLDLLMGAWMDRTRTRFGRFRPWVAAGGVLLLAGVALAFFARPGTPPGVALLFLIVAYAGNSALLLGQTAWGTTLTPDYGERARLFGWWQAANLLGLLLTTLVPPLFGGGSPAGAVHAMGLWSLALTVLTVLPMILWTAEAADARPPHHARLREMAGLARDPLLMRLLAADLLVNLAPGITGGLFRFYFERVLHYDGRDTGLLLFVYFVAGLLSIPVWSWLARRTSKHRAMWWSGVAYAVLQTGTLTLPPGDFWRAAIGMALAGVPYAAAPFLLRALLGDVADVDRLRTGVDRTGLLTAVLTTTLKVGYAIPVGLTYAALSAAGFEPVPGTGGAGRGLGALMTMFTIVPASLMLAGCLLMRRWPLDAAAHAEMRAALAARDAGASRAG